MDEGYNRDELGLALVAALRKCGFDDNVATRKAVRAGMAKTEIFCTFGIL